MHITKYILVSNFMIVIGLLSVRTAEAIKPKARPSTSITLPEGKAVAQLQEKRSREGKGALLMYRGKCKNGGDIDFTLNSLGVQSNRHDRAMTDVNELLKEDTNFSSIPLGHGLDFIKDSRASAPILRIKLHNFELNKDARFNPELTLEGLMRNSSVIANLGTSVISRPHTGGLREIPSESRPHMAASFSGDVQELLTLQLRTFGGLAIYGECVLPSGKLLYDLNFYRDDRFLR